MFMLKYLLIIYLFCIPIESQAGGIAGYWDIKEHGMRVLINPIDNGNMYLILNMVKENANLPFLGKFKFEKDIYSFLVESPPIKVNNFCVEHYEIISTGKLIKNIFNNKSILMYEKNCKGKEPELKYILLSGEWKKVSRGIQIKN